MERFIKSLSNILIILGFIVIGIYGVRYARYRLELYEHMRQYRLAPDGYMINYRGKRVDLAEALPKYGPKKEIKATTPPTRIIIPAIAVDQKIESVGVENGIPLLSDTLTNHLENSAKPGDSGNIIIYGHNHRDILGNLLFVEEGDQIVLVDESNNLHTYKVVTQDEVWPSETDLLADSDEEVLTIYTCSDFLGSKRFVVRAEK